MSHGSQDKVLETHGLALQEALSHFSSSEEKKKFKLILERMVERLKSIEHHGYSPQPPEPEPEPEEVIVEKQQPAAKEAKTTPASATVPTSTDSGSQD